MVSLVRCDSHRGRRVVSPRLEALPLGARSKVPLLLEARPKRGWRPSGVRLPRRVDRRGDLTQYGRRVASSTRTGSLLPPCETSWYESRRLEVPWMAWFAWSSRPRGGARAEGRRRHGCRRDAWSARPRPSIPWMRGRGSGSHGDAACRGRVVARDRITGCSQR